MSLDDRALIARVLEQQDQRAFGELVKKHQSQLRYSLRQITGWDQALADDLAQETFIKAYRSLHQFRGDSGFFTWLYKIAFHCFLAHKRAAKPEDNLGDTELPDQGSDPEQALDLHRDFARALLAFPPDQRMVLHLHFQKEMTHQEVSDLLGLPLGTVKSHIQRGRESLALRLEGWQIGEATI